MVIVLLLDARMTCIRYVHSWNGIDNEHELSLGPVAVCERGEGGKGKNIGALRGG